MTDKQKKRAFWRQKSTECKDEIKDICRRIAEGDIQIGSEEFHFLLDVIHNDAGRVHTYDSMISASEQVEDMRGF